MLSSFENNYTKRKFISFHSTNLRTHAKTCKHWLTTTVRVHAFYCHYCVNPIFTVLKHLTCQTEMLGMNEEPSWPSWNGSMMLSLNNTKWCHAAIWYVDLGLCNSAFLWYELRKGWGSWACSAWRREGCEGTL